MRKLNKKEEIEKLKQALMKKIKKENDSRYVNLSPDEIIKTIINSSLNGKYSLWIIREYLKGNIQRFEDMGRVKQALTLFKNNLSKFTEQQKQLNKLFFQELENLVEPYQDVLTQNEIKRMNKEKIWSEIDVIYEGLEGRIYVPRTEQASVFLGQGTRWCTAAAKHNMFDFYNNKGPLYVFILPEKDEMGREIKYQLQFESNQFMDSEDEKVQYHSNSCLLKLINILTENLSMKQKIKHFLKTDCSFSSWFDFSHDLENVLFVEKAKTSTNLAKTITKFMKKELYEIVVKQNGYDLKYIPEELKTQELCWLAVKQNGYALNFVPAEFITEELCELVVEKNGYDLKHLPAEHRTKRLCEIAVRKDIFAFEYVPTEHRTKELCELAVQQDGNLLLCVPMEHRTKDLCETAVLQNGNALQYVPEEYKTGELYEMAAKHSGFALKYIPNTFITQELCKISVQKNGNALQYVPHRFVTTELYKLAVQQDGDALYCIPIEYRTKELCELAVKQNGSALYHVPTEHRTQELCEIAVTQNGLALCYIPEHFTTKELCELAVRQNGNALEYVLMEFQTKELCELAVKQNGEALNYVPDEFKTKKMLEICVGEQNHKNNTNYSFDETLEMIFSDESNQIKDICKVIKTHFISCYIELRSEQLSLEFDPIRKYNL